MSAKREHGFALIEIVCSTLSSLPTQKLFALRAHLQAGCLRSQRKLRAYPKVTFDS